MQAVLSVMPCRRLAALLGLATLALAPPARADTPPAADIPPMARQVKGFDLALLAPVDGVTLEQVGEASYYFGFLPTMTKDQVLDEVGVDKAHYDEAQKVFTQRMIDDKTFTITSLFGAYADEAAQGHYAAYDHDVAHSVLAGNAPLLEPAPMSEEQFRSIQEYYARKAPTAGTRPADLDMVLITFGLTYNDFQILSGWFGRRFGLQATAADGGAPPGATDPVANAAPPAPPRPKLGGMWHIAWAILKRGDAGMEVVRQSRDVCLTAGMTAATLPLMPKRAKCALPRIAFYDTGIGFGAQCDDGAFGSSWSLDLQPDDPAQVPPGSPATQSAGYNGEMQFSMENEHLHDLAPKASTPVTAQRIGDCK